MFIYLEATDLEPGSTARLFLPQFKPQDVDILKCLSFQQQTIGMHQGGVNVLDEHGNIIMPVETESMLKFSSYFLTINFPYFPFF